MIPPEQIQLPKIALNPIGIPDALKELPNWVIWALVTQDNNKPDKRPVYIIPPKFGQPKSTIGYAKWSSKENQLTYDKALALYNANRHVLAGIGFILNKDDGIVCIDLDSMPDPTTNDPRTPWLDKLSKISYTEVSQSGNGTHTFIRADIDRNYPKSNNPNAPVETYHSNRFIAVTGQARPDQTTLNTIGTQQANQPLVNSIISTFHQNTSDDTNKQRQPYERPTTIPEGQRDNALTQHAGYLINKDMPDNEAMADMCKLNAEACKPPLPLEDVARIYASIKGKHQAKKDQDANLNKKLVSTLCHVGDSNLWYDMDTMHARKTDSLNIKHMKMFPGGKDNNPKIATWLPLQHGFLDVDTVTWIPKPYGTIHKVITEDGIDKLNLWNGFAITPAEGDIDPWLALLSHVVPEEDYREAFLFWLAFTIQHPDIKLQWQIIIIGMSGAGKDTLLNPMARIFGDAYRSSGNKDTKGNFDDTLFKTKLLQISEASGMRGEHIEFFKRIAASEASDKMTLNIKQSGQVVQPNLFSIVAMTNDIAAFKFDVNERRALVLNAPKKMDDKDADAYYGGWLKNNGANHLFHYLLNYDLDASPYSHSKLPYRTTHFYNMNDVSRSDSDVFVDEYITDYEAILPQLLVEKLILTKGNNNVSAATKHLLSTGWARWDAGDNSRRIKKSVDGKQKSEPRGWLIRKDGSLTNSRPSVMYDACQASRTMMTKQSKFG